MNVSIYVIDVGFLDIDHCFHACIKAITTLRIKRGKGHAALAEYSYANKVLQELIQNP